MAWLAFSFLLSEKASFPELPEAAWRNSLHTENIKSIRGALVSGGCSNIHGQLECLRRRVMWNTACIWKFLMHISHCTTYLHLVLRYITLFLVWAGDCVWHAEHTFMNICIKLFLKNTLCFVPGTYAISELSREILLLFNKKIGYIPPVEPKVGWWWWGTSVAQTRSHQ